VSKTLDSRAASEDEMVVELRGRGKRDGDVLVGEDEEG